MLLGTCKSRLPGKRISKLLSRRRRRLPGRRIISQPGRIRRFPRYIQSVGISPQIEKEDVSVCGSWLVTVVA